MPRNVRSQTPRPLRGAQPAVLLLLLVLSALFAACSTDSSSPPTPIPTLTPTPIPEPTEMPTPVFSSDPFKDGMIARRNGDYARAAAAFQLVLNSNPTPDLLSEAQFRLGEADWLKNDFARAVLVLNAYLQAYPNGAHAPEAHYFLADAYRAQKDFANALAHLRLYRDQSPTLVGDTDAAIGDVMVAAGDFANALVQYDRALQDATLSASARINILLRAADVHSGRAQPALAAARYDAALALASDARMRADLYLRAGEAYAAARMLDPAVGRWNTAITQYPDQPGAYQALIDLVNRGAAVDDFQRGLVDYFAGAYDAAIAAFQRYLQNDSARAGDAQFYIASSYARKGAPSQAIAAYDGVIRALSKDKRVPDAYLGKAAAYGVIGQVDEAVAVYKKFASLYPDDARADDALWRAALLLDRVKRYGDAADVYEQMRAKYPGREHAVDALFAAGLDEYRTKDFKTASTRWQALVKDYPQFPAVARGLFWLGKTAKARGQEETAKNYWAQAAASRDASLPERSYYAWRAASLLPPAKTNSDSRRYDPARYSMDNPADRAEFEKWLAGWAKSSAALGTLDAATRDDLRFRRGAELLRLDRTVDARREFVPLVAAKQADALALYALTLYLRDNNLFSLSIDCAERIARLASNAGAPDAPRWLWMLRYPTFYGDLVVAEAQTNQIAPLLYFALIRQESSFNPWSTSSSDARGLAQIIPSTGREIAQKLGARTFALDQLYLPFVSVKFGVWYFAQELKKFDEPIYALAAYNAGSGRVANWQRPDLDLAVEEIDLSETSAYVRIVYSNWRQYQEIYK